MNFNKMLLLFISLLITASIFISACDNRLLDPEDENDGSGEYVLTMWAEPDTIYADDDNATYSIIHVKVKDLDDFVIPEQRVNFGANMGNIIAYDITDSSGIATVEFWDDGVPGTATISANTDHIEFDDDGNEITTTISETISVGIIPNQSGPSNEYVNSIGFDFQGQVDIQVAGTGGNETYNFAVSLYDISGELIDDPKDVYFQFVNAPDGTNINNSIFWPSQDSISVTSANGKAHIPITSGTESGTVSLKAFVYNNNGQMISTTKSNIVISSGPPNSVEIGTGGIDSAADMSGGVWQIQCAALLNDVHGNPVSYGTAVWFSLPDDPDWAVVNSDAYVGNENANGDSLPGIAYTTLNFYGAHINDTLMVSVEVSNNVPNEPNFTDTQQIIMPIQFAEIEMIAIPQHIDWDQYDNPPNWKSEELNLSPRVRVLVRDGQQNLISNQEVTFTSTLGAPVNENQLSMLPTNPSFEPDYTDLTGPDNDGEPLTDTDVNLGEIVQLFRFYKHECPEPVPAPPGTIQAQITATVVGTQTSATVQIVLNRYID